MKNNFISIPLFFFFIFLTAASCKKPGSNNSDQLPPETTIGAMTFGCKVNGEVFVPKDGNGKLGLYVQYVYLGNGPGGGWYLNIPAVNYQTQPNTGVSLQTDSLLLNEGKTYEFRLINYTPIKGTPNAFYYNGSNTYPKLDNETGNLYITRFDQNNRILSGTFSFVGTNVNGGKVNVTEGRFDIRY